MTCPEYIEDDYLDEDEWLSIDEQDRREESEHGYE